MYRGYENTKIAVKHITVKGNSEWLLFWPGLGYTHRNKFFKSLINELKRDYNLLIPDLRSHGDSEGAFSFENLCEDIKIISKKIIEEYPDITIVGHSVSATALAEVADDLPQARVVLFAPINTLYHRVPLPVRLLVNYTPSFVSVGFLKLALFLTNIKTMNIRSSGLKRSMSQWGECRLDKSLSRVWKEAAAFNYEFKKLHQEGAVIYGPKDKLIDNLGDYEESIEKTGLDIVRVEGLGHHFKSRKKGRSEHWKTVVAEAIRGAAKSPKPSVQTKKAIPA